MRVLVSHPQKHANPECPCLCDFVRILSFARTGGRQSLFASQIECFVVGGVLGLYNLKGGAGAARMVCLTVPLEFASEGGFIRSSVEYVV